MHNAMSNQARAEQRQFQRKEHADDKTQLKAVNDLLDERDKEIKAFASKAADEIKQHGTILEETKTILDGLVKDGLGLQDRLQEIEQKMARRFSANDPVDVKSVGEELSETEEFKALQTRGRGIARIGRKAVTNITSATSGTGGVGVAIQPTRLPGIITEPERQFTIRDLIMPGRTSSNAIEYVRESGFQNMAAPRLVRGQPRPSRICPSRSRPLRCVPSPTGSGLRSRSCPTSRSCRATSMAVRFMA